MKVDLSGLRPFLAMPVFSQLPPETVLSLLKTQAECHRLGIPLEIRMAVGATVFHARSAGAHDFLRSEYNRLFMIDADMTWEPRDFLRLLALSSKRECVCATYLSRSDPPVFYVNMPSEVTTDELGCIEIESAGLGFTVVDRSVIQRLADLAPKIHVPVVPGEPIAKVFRFDELNGHARSEDIAFFADVRALGVPVHLDPSIALGHIGVSERKARFLDQLSAAQEAA